MRIELRPRRRHRLQEVASVEASRASELSVSRVLPADAKGSIRKGQAEIFDVNFFNLRVEPAVSRRLPHRPGLAQLTHPVLQREDSLRTERPRQLDINGFVNDAGCGQREMPIKQFP
jgi:hypothetical protein